MFGAAVVAAVLGGAPVAATPVTAYKQAVAESVSRSDKLAQYYRARDFAPIWTGADEASRDRRAALLAAFDLAAPHGLPEGKYDAAALRARMAAAVTPRDRGLLEVELSRIFLDFATDLQTGILTPSQVIADIHREVPLRDASEYLDGIQGENPGAFIRKLPPSHPEYARLLKAKLDLERRLGTGGWGPTVPMAKLEPGDEGRNVVLLRNRLIAMGYLPRSVSTRYDAQMQEAVQEFQRDHGLNADGVAGDGTLTEVNVAMEDRLKSIVVAMERERWLNRPLGDRHILVNLTDFHARIVDYGKVTFKTRSVIGKNASDRRSPEFSDVMEHMVINPTWNVPRSIATKEYLPQLQQNPWSNGHLRITDARGQIVDRGAVNFAAYNARNFPFDLKQPPSERNALGLVKFMFPNQYNIYLHDTPQKSLFAREERDFSHGCIRLADPFDFAYALLARQTADPKGYFHSVLQTGRETTVPLDVPVQVHLIYRTAVSEAKGRMNYRRDVYGRDAQIWDALEQAGVSLPAVRG
ncbi:murein L,D-transpeptidase [Pseudooceanicola sp. LIPI14-2-Ac024]|uniref:L,D-transpeptidase family protein n=1 Tax=Pseudooceanicola sp. LIPI14-2-Ac024 TaxID=3344875 RepID=UPI0035CF7F6B